MDCKTVHSKLLDFLNHSIPAEEGNALQAHLAECDTCRAEHTELAAIIAHTRNNPVPDPGDAHWNAFPDQVLSAFKSQQTQVKHDIRISDWWVSLLKRWQQYTWANIAIPAMLVVFAITFGLYWQSNQTTPHFDSLALQQKLDINVKHATQIYPYLQHDTQASNFSFSAGDQNTNYFYTGRLYAEILALLSVEDKVSAQKKFDALQKSVTNEGSDLHIQLEHISKLFVTGADRPKLLSTLGQLQPLLEQAALKTSKEQQELFRLGSWLVDVKLALAVKPVELISQTATFSYFKEQLPTAPQGVRASLQQMEDLLQNDIQHASDKQQLLDLINNIQLILG